MSLKIALVTPWKARCGIYTYCRDLSEALVEFGVDVYIIRLPRFGRKDQNIMRCVAEKTPWKDVDLIHISHEYGLFQQLESTFYGVLKGFDRPVLTTMHSVGDYRIDPIIVSQSDGVVVHNQYCFDRLGERFQEKAVIIPHGTTPHEPVPGGEAKKSLGIPPTAKMVGYFGFLSTYKGVEHLIEAMAGVPQAGLLIAGGWHVDAETKYITSLKRMSLRLLPGRVQWLGYVEDEDVDRVFGSMDLVCYPSRFATESGALLTALSHGKAVIASDLKPFQEKEERGALTTFENVKELTEKINHLLGDVEARRELEEGALDYAESVSWGRVAEKHVELYKETVENFKE